MSGILHSIKSKVQGTINETNLKIATATSLIKSNEIKERIRTKLESLTEEQKQQSAHADLLAIHAKIEANHDVIYKRPEKGSSASSAKEECDALLVTQQSLELNFNNCYETLTNTKEAVLETVVEAVDNTIKKSVETIEEKTFEVKSVAKDTINEFADKVTDTKDAVAKKVADTNVLKLKP